MLQDEQSVRTFSCIEIRESRESAGNAKEIPANDIRGCSEKDVRNKIISKNVGVQEQPSETMIADEKERSHSEGMSSTVLQGRICSGLLYQWSADDNAGFRAQILKVLSTGVPKHSRNAFDLAGKLPLTILLLSAGFSFKDVIIDYAGACDGFIVGLKEKIEIKSCKRKLETKNTYQVKKIDFKGNQWKHLFLVCRPREPTNWTDFKEYCDCGFQLGYMRREDLRKTTGDDVEKVSVTFTPGHCPKSRNSPAGYVHWVHFKDFSLEWWNRTVVRKRTIREVERIKDTSSKVIDLTED